MRILRSLVLAIALLAILVPLVVVVATGLVDLELRRAR